MKEMRSRVCRITNDLNGLREELAAVREPNARKSIEGSLTPDVIKAFKSSVDEMRRLLWETIEASSRNGSSPQQEGTLQGVVDALRSMRETASASPMPKEAGLGSFIEKVEALVERKMK